MLSLSHTEKAAKQEASEPETKVDGEEAGDKQGLCSASLDAMYCVSSDIIQNSSSLFFASVFLWHFLFEQTP